MGNGAHDPWVRDLIDLEATYGPQGARSAREEPERYGLSRERAAQLSREAEEGFRGERMQPLLPRIVPQRDPNVANAGLRYFLTGNPNVPAPTQENISDEMFNRLFPMDFPAPEQFLVDMLPAFSESGGLGGGLGGGLQVIDPVTGGVPEAAQPRIDLPAFEGRGEFLFEELGGAGDRGAQRGRTRTTGKEALSPDDFREALQRIQAGLPLPDWAIRTQLVADIGPNGELVQVEEFSPQTLFLIEEAERVQQRLAGVNQLDFRGEQLTETNRAAEEQEKIAREQLAQQLGISGDELEFRLEQARLDREQRGDLASSARGLERSQGAAERALQEDLARSQRALTRSQGAAERTSREGIAGQQDALQRHLAEVGVGEADLDRELRRELAELGFTGQEAERELQEALAERNLTLQREEGAAGRGLAREEGAAERTSREGIAGQQDALQRHLAEVGVGEADLDRELRRELAELGFTGQEAERELQEALAERNRTLTREEGAAGRRFAGEQGAAERTLQREQGASQRLFTQEESARQRAFLRSENARERSLARDTLVARAEEAASERSLRREEGASARILERDRLAQQFDLARRERSFQREGLRQQQRQFAATQQQQAGLAQLGALTQVFQGALQNPFAFAAARATDQPFLQALSPLGLQLGQGGGQPALPQGQGPVPQLFPGGQPTLGALQQIPPEALQFLNAVLGFQGVGPGQFAQAAGGVTPGSRALSAPGQIATAARGR